jgi:glycerol-3-phosphate acyltransferase PlsY
MKLLGLLLGAYLLGSVPFGLLAARLKGVDPRRVGSGNIGATNVLRAAGAGPAALTLLGDALKGALPVLLARAWGLEPGGQGLVGLAAVLGHDFSLWLRLRGGKGVATTLGVALAYAPWAGLLCLFCWVAVALLARYSSLAALLSLGIALPLAVAALYGEPAMVLTALALAGLILWRHTGNIKRLLRGQEPRLGKKTA